MTAATHLRWNKHGVARGRGLVYLRNNILNKYKAYLCGAYTPAAVTEKPKIYGVSSSVEAPPTGGRYGWRQVTLGDPYADECEVGADLFGDTGFLGFWDPFSICVFDIHVVEDTHTKYFISMNGAIRSNILRLSLRDYVTSCYLCYQCVCVGGGGVRN